MASSDGAVRTYGNWIPQRSPGIGSTGLLGTGLIFVGMVSTMFGLALGGFKAGLIVAAVFAVGFVLVATPVGGNLVRRARFWQGRAKRDTVWRSGALEPARKRNVNSRNPSLRLPGVLSRIEPLTGTDAYGSPFSVLYNPLAGGTYTMVARCAPEGPAMQDQDTIDTWVSNYATLLTTEAAEDGLICAAAITDSAPDPGGTLRSQIETQRSSNAPAMASEVMDEVSYDLPGRSHRDVTYLAVTYSQKRLAHKAGSGHDEELSDLARRVPGLLGQCKASGSPSVRMCTEDELARVVRYAYDPASERVADEAERDPEVDSSQQLVPWDEAGPVGYQTGWSSMRSDSGLHVSWEMTRPPQSAVRELAMRRLLGAQSEVVRKRVALIYRPHGPDQSMKVSENDVNTARLTSSTNSGKRMSAAAKRSIEAAEKASGEVAAGAALTRFSVMVTATVTRDEDLPRAVRSVESRAGSVPIRLRRCYGAQDAAFAATLPVGFVPWLHTNIPTEVREMLL